MRILFFIFISLIFTVMWGSKVYALSCIQAPITFLPTIYNGADLIFLGRPIGNNSNRDFVEYKVLENFKGISKSPVRVYYSGGHIAGASKPNRENLVIASNVNGYISGSLCWPVDQNYLKTFRFIKYVVILILSAISFFIIRMGYRKFFNKRLDRGLDD